LAPLREPFVLPNLQPTGYDIFENAIITKPIRRVSQSVLKPRPQRMNLALLKTYFYRQTLLPMFD